MTFAKRIKQNAKLDRNVPVRWQVQIIRSFVRSFIRKIGKGQENYIVRFETFQTEKGTQRTKTPIQKSQLFFLLCRLNRTVVLNGR